MPAAAIPDNEKERLEAVRRANVLDTPAEERFDRLTRLAKRLFGVPMALVSIVDADRQWFKSVQGMDIAQTPRNVSFCGHALLGDDLLMVPDAILDERFIDNPLVTGNPNIRFYAGCPLAVASGHKVGTLCLLDVKPRDLTEEDRELLKDLAGMAEQELAAVRLASTDELTHLSNRRGFESLAQRALDACSRHGEAAELCFFDLDKFKQINDAHGHAEGDWALKAFASALKEAVGPMGLAARQSGDEFVALLVGAQPSEGDAAIERLREAIAQENQRAASKGYEIGFSVGRIPVAPGEAASVGALLARADAAMYADKAARKSR